MFRLPLILDDAAGPSATVARLLAPDGEQILARALDGTTTSTENKLAAEAGRAGSPGHHEPGLAELPPVEGKLARHLPAAPAALDARAVADAMRLHGADLAVVGPLPSLSARARVNLAARLALQHGCCVLSVGDRCPAPEGPLRHLAFATEADHDDLESLSALLARLDRPVRVSGLLVRPGPARRAALEAALRSPRVAEPAVIEVSAFLTTLAEAVERAALAAGADLVVVPGDALSDLAALAQGFFAAETLQHAQRPTLILPRLAGTPAIFADRLHCSDTLCLPLAATAPLAVEHAGPLGRARLAPLERVVVGALPPAGHELGVVGPPAARLREAAGSPLAVAIEGAPAQRCLVNALVPDRPLVLVDAQASAEVLAPLQPLVSACHLVFVRLRWDDPLEAVRHRLGQRAPWAGLPTVIDASAWLDDGGADDLPGALDAQRLRRLGARLSLLGAQVQALVPATPAEPVPPLPSAPSLPSTRPTQSTRSTQSTPDELDLACGAERLEGNSVEVSLENAQARTTLLARLAAARGTICWQCYIVEEGPVGEQFAAALVAAAGRGVRVRLLVDALYSRHEALRSRNALLDRLAAVEGVEVRAFRPIPGVPDVVALKQRNHRKLVVVDGEVAVVTGRNLGGPYFTGFHEIALTRTTNYREIPWLDLGAVVHGPVVAAVERAFLDGWTEAGGQPFALDPVPPRAGSAACRLVVHDGLRDTRTFDTQLALVRRARRRVLAVNSFPLAIELQRALVAAAKRGVRVQVLHGSVRPRWGEDVPFEGGLLRTLADQLIRARLDPVAQAGGEVCEFALPPLPGWEPELRRVYPHVHAKLVVRDEEEVAVGSANLDVTAAYWESEAMLLVEDAAVARDFLAAFEPLLAASRRADPSDPRWQEEAARRVRLGRSWPALIG